jgi:hypothetical protein
MQAYGKVRATGLQPRGARRPLWCAGLAIIVQLCLWGVETSPVLGQPVPLADVVPTWDELETPVDELMRLATGYADAMREWKTAKLTADTLQVLRPNALITNLEVQIARVNVETAEAKVVVLRAICQKQLEAATSRLELIKRLESIGAQAPAEGGVNQSRIRVMQAEATVAILKMILAIK